MRTTVDLPPDVLRAAKVRAAERGESLKVLLTRAITYEVGNLAVDSTERVQLPLISSPRPGSGDIQNVDIEQALSDEDADKHRSR